MPVERRNPACRGAAYGTDQSAAAHGPHGFFPWRMSDGAIPCPGWTEREAGATVLADRLDQVARDHWWPLSMPPGIRLECHPLVPHALQQIFIPSYNEFVSSLSTGEDLVKPQMPIVVTPGMERGQWRITADDGLIAEGVVSDG